VHDILQHATSADDVAGLSAVWGRRHSVTADDQSAAAEAARRALEYVAGAMPGGAERHRELEVIVRLQDGTLVGGRIDLAWRDESSWTVVDYKTDRREKRKVSQVQLYALALERATGMAARGIVLEV
jgi:ATP-dependent exoDNAse (exonuclease V) beta subunit